MDESSGHGESLTSALRALADDEATRGASPGVELRLLGEVRSMAHARQRRERAMAVGLAVALIIIALGAVGVPLWHIAHRPSARADAHLVPSSDDIAAAFLPLGYSGIPVTGAQIVRIEVPRAALTSFGVTQVGTVSGSSSGTVLADVLVGEDGLARAVRFVRTTSYQEQQR